MKLVVSGSLLWLERCYLWNFAGSDLLLIPTNTKMSYWWGNFNHDRSIHFLTLWIILGSCFYKFLTASLQLSNWLCHFILSIWWISNIVWSVRRCELYLYTSIFVNIGYNCCFISSLLKFLGEKKNIMAHGLLFFHREIWIAKLEIKCQLYPKSIKIDAFIKKKAYRSLNRITSYLKKWQFWVDFAIVLFKM